MNIKIAGKWMFIPLKMVLIGTVLIHTHIDFNHAIITFHRFYWVISSPRKNQRFLAGDDSPNPSSHHSSAGKRHEVILIHSEYVTCIYIYIHIHIYIYIYCPLYIYNIYIYILFEGYRLTWWSSYIVRPRFAIIRLSLSLIWHSHQINKFDMLRP